MLIKNPVTRVIYAVIGMAAYVRILLLLGRWLHWEGTPQRLTGRFLFFGLFFLYLWPLVLGQWWKPLFGTVAAVLLMWVVTALSQELMFWISVAVAFAVFLVIIARTADAH